LWWLAVLYRRPKTLVDSLGLLPRIEQVRVGFSLWLHALPYVLVLTAVARVGLLRLSGTPWSWTASGAPLIALGSAVGMALGIAIADSSMPRASFSSSCRGRGITAAYQMAKAMRQAVQAARTARTTGLDDRRGDEVLLDEVKRIRDLNSPTSRRRSGKS
jgi:hypothetical protein